MILKMNLTDQYLIFQGAPALPCAERLQYKYACEDKSTYSEHECKEKRSCQSENDLFSRHNENDDNYGSINAVNRVSFDTQCSLAAAARSATHETPGHVFDSLSDSRIMSRMRAHIMYTLQFIPSPLSTISHFHFYQTRVWGSQPQAGVAALIQLAGPRVRCSRAAYLSSICHACHWSDDNPAHIRARCPRLNQECAAAGFRDAIIWSTPGHPSSAFFQRKDVFPRKSISELIMIFSHHDLYTHFLSIFKARYSYHLIPIFRYV